MNKFLTRSLESMIQFIRKSATIRSDSQSIDSEPLSAVGIYRVT